MPKLTNSYPALVDFNSTALIELEPISSPTNCLLFFPPSHISRPLSLSPRLAAPHMCLAHLAFHPAIQDRLAKFPAVAQLECRNLAFRDVAIQRVRRDPQIL